MVRDMRNTLYVRRAERRISQMALAREVGIPFYRYWKLENNYLDPSASDRAKLAAYFDCAESLIFPDPPAAEAPTDDDHAAAS